MRVFSIFLLLVSIRPVLAATAPAHWPPEAKAYLKTLPKQKLTLDFVVKAAILRADIFDVHKADFKSAEAGSMSVTASEDLEVFGSHARQRNENEPLNPFEPIMSKGWTSTLGLRKFFSSGTALSLESSTGRNNFTLGPMAGGNNRDTKQSSVTLRLEQNLLSDFFGTKYRSYRRAAEYQKKSLQAAAINKIEGSVVDIIDLYYGAWFKKETTLNLQAGLKRRRKLLRIIRANRRRGTAEESDLLQVEAASLDADVEYEKNHRELRDMWEYLVITLKMPKALLTVDPLTIPIALDEPISTAETLCQKKSSGQVKEASSQLQNAVLAFEAARNQLKAAKKGLLPELKLRASYNLNGVDPVTSETYREVFDSDNPAWSAELAVSFPLQNTQKKSEYLQKLADFERAQANLSRIDGDISADWNSLCETLKTKKQIRDRYKTMSVKNRRRVKLDNRRFRVGRIRANQWVQSEDDESRVSVAYKSSEVELRQLAWKIQRLTGRMNKELKAAMRGSIE